MPKSDKSDKKKLLVIINNLDEFTEKLLTRIADESHDGCEELINVISAAKTRYEKPIHSYLTGWIFSYSRTRGKSIDLAVRGMETFPDAYTRLQEFQLLVGAGEWNDGSFNYYLLDELIKRIPGYAPLPKEQAHSVILAVRDLIKDKIELFMAQYAANALAIKQKNDELLKMQTASLELLGHVTVVNNSDKLKQTTLAQSQKIHFTLALHDEKWKLCLLDTTGKAYPLEMSKELLAALKQYKITDIADIKPTSPQNIQLVTQIKKECMKSREDFFKRLILIVNPHEGVPQNALTNQQLIEKGVFSTFVLRGDAAHHSLDWINSLGKVSSIDLHFYPKLKHWLDTQKFPLCDDQLPQLKLYLLQVNTSKNIGRKAFKEQLAHCLAQGPSTFVKKENEQEIKKLDPQLLAPVQRCVASQLGLPAERVQASVGKLNLSQFNEVATLFGSKSIALSKKVLNKSEESSPDNAAEMKYIG